MSVLTMTAAHSCNFDCVSIYWHYQSRGRPDPNSCPNLYMGMLPVRVLRDWSTGVVRHYEH